MIIWGASGVKFEARKFRGRDIQAVNDKVEDGSVTDAGMCHLLSACWERTVDPGPYELEPDAKPNFYNQILKSDVACLLLTLRQGSFRNGDEYAFKTRCQSDDCRKPIESWHISLGKHVLSRVRTLTP